MNKKTLGEITQLVEKLETLIDEEREKLDNREESFGETMRWQEEDEICSNATDSVSELLDCIERWNNL